MLRLRNTTRYFAAIGTLALLMLGAAAPPTGNSWTVVNLHPSGATASRANSVGSGKQVGYASSGSWSPLLKQYLALAHIRAPHAAPGTEVRLEVTVEHQRRHARARVTALPFFDPERKKA